MAALIAALKSIPILKDFFDKFLEMWLYHQDIKDENNTIKKMHLREAVFKSLKNQELTNGERSELRRVLYSINNS